MALHKSEEGFGIGVEGQEIEGRGTACFVITCAAESEAAQQQVEVGDEVVSIAGVPIDGHGMQVTIIRSRF